MRNGLVDVVGGRFTRRQVLRGAGAVAVGAGLVGLRVGGIAAQESNPDGDAGDAFAKVALPPDLGQTNLQVYVPATGHTVRGCMLDYWRATGAAVYGNPISEPFVAADGSYSQAFERGIFQYRPEHLDTADPIIRLMPLGRIALAGRLGGAVGDRRGGDRRAERWQALDAGSAAARGAVNAGGALVEETGHTIAGELLAWYAAHEGAFYLGNPLSQPVAERGVIAQYFDAGLLLGSGQGTALAPLATEAAHALGIDTAPVAEGDLPTYDEALFATGDNPNPRGDATAPGRKRIEVSIAQQQLWAYQGDTRVLETPVSTGIEPNHTERGVFHVRIKFPKQDMQGFTNESGEVVGFGEDAPDGTIAYDVKDIPHVLYFDLDAEALHGCYWHHNFGNPMSHGCVNLPLDVAAWMYGWAPLGTEVRMHE